MNDEYRNLTNAASVLNFLFFAAKFWTLKLKQALVWFFHSFNTPSLFVFCCSGIFFHKFSQRIELICDEFINEFCHWNISRCTKWRFNPLSWHTNGATQVLFHCCSLTFQISLQICYEYANKSSLKFNEWSRIRWIWFCLSQNIRWDSQSAEGWKGRCIIPWALLTYIQMQALRFPIRH